MGHAAYGDGSYILSNGDMRWFWNHYLNGAADQRNPLAAPLLADLRSLPPLLVTASEFDPLHDDSTGLVARLEEAGWVKREICETDRRGQLAVLTDAGFAALEAAAPGHVEGVRTHLFDPLSPEQVKQLGEICETIADHLREGESEPRAC